jgi:hypothetical protein
MPTSSGMANKEHHFRIVRLKGTSNFSLVGYVSATNKTEAIEKAIKEYNVPEKLRGRLEAYLSRTRTLPRAASLVVSESSYELGWKFYADLKSKR